MGFSVCFQNTHIPNDLVTNMRNFSECCPKSSNGLTELVFSPHWKCTCPFTILLASTQNTYKRSKDTHRGLFLTALFDKSAKSPLNSIFCYISIKQRG